MDASVKKILTDLRARKFGMVYFLMGEETYYIDRISDFIEQHALSDAEKGFNQVVLYGKDAPMAMILTHARRFPMMADRQVVIIKEAQEISDLNKETGARLLLDYVQKPVPSTILVFCHKHKALDKRRELGKKIDKYAITINTKKLYGNQMPDFVNEYAKENNLKIEDRAVQAMCEYVGNDLHRIANEIDKLAIALPPGESITTDRVLNQVGVSKEYNIFELQKAIINRDILTANKIVNYFEGNTRKNPIIPVVAFLFSFFSKLLVASQVHDKSDKGLVSALKMSPYAVRDYSLALRQYQTGKIIQNIALLKETDLKLKGVNSGSEGDGQLFRELVFRLMHAV